MRGEIWYANPARTMMDVELVAVSGFGRKIAMDFAVEGERLSSSLGYDPEREHYLGRCQRKGHLDKGTGIDCEIFARRSGKLSCEVFRSVCGGSRGLSPVLHQCSIGLKPPLKQSNEPFDAEFASAWDANGVYLALKVKEKDFIPPPAGAPVFLYDSLEIMIDQANDAREEVKECDKNDCIFFLSLKAGKPVLELIEAAAGQKPGPVEGGLGAVTRGNGETAFEAFIPASVLSSAEFKPGANIGFALKLHNRERVSSDQETWNIHVSCPEYPCGRPDRWNDLLMSGD